MELMLLGEVIDARRAYEVGMVNRLVAPGQHMEEARKLARRLAANAPLVMSMTNLTCYYYSMFVLTAALAAVRKPLGVVVLVCSGASQILILNYYWVDDKFTAQAWLFGVFSLVLLAGYSRPFSFARLSAWWNGKPEPKSSRSSSSGPGTPQPTPAE